MPKSTNTNPATTEGSDETVPPTDAQTGEVVTNDATATVDTTGTDVDPVTQRPEDAPKVEERPVTQVMKYNGVPGETRQLGAPDFKFLNAASDLKATKWDEKNNWQVDATDWTDEDIAAVVKLTKFELVTIEPKTPEA